MKIANTDIALIGFNKDKSSLDSDLEFVKHNKYLAIFSTWLIQEDFYELYKINLPFKLFINTGNKKLDYVYIIKDFVTLRGSKGITCPNEWKKYINVSEADLDTLKESDYCIYPDNPKMPIKTWFLVESVLKIEDKRINWDSLVDIRGMQAKNPGKSYFLYVKDPLV